jgi:hypothetical protein
MAALYQYVGPPEFRTRAFESGSAGTCIRSPGDLALWGAKKAPSNKPNHEFVVTFVVCEDGFLLIADRRSEHVACAGGQAVLAAGELSFAILKHGVQILWITNQSTGYCPEPSCWIAVASAVRRAGADPPDGFSQTFDYRRCEHCQTITIIKDGLFRCEVCRAKLPELWNLAAKG